MIIPHAKRALAVAAFSICDVSPLCPNQGSFSDNYLCNPDFITGSARKAAIGYSI